MDKITSQFSGLLARFDLIDNEAKVYEILVKHGSMTAQSLGLHLPKINRTNLYAVLNSLQTKDMVFQKQTGAKAEFVPVDPNQLYNLLAAEEKELETNKNLLSALLPDLSNIYQLSTQRPAVRIFEGREGIKEIYLDTIGSKQPIFSFLGLSEIDESIGRWLRRYYAPMRIKAKIPAKVIISADKSDSETRSYIQRSKQELREIKVVEKKLFPAVVEVQTYGDKVSFANYNKSDALIGVIIENKFIAETMRGVFKLGWSVV